MRLPQCACILVAPVCAALVVLLVATCPALASDEVQAQALSVAPMQAQVQVPVLGIDFNPTKWVEDAFAALLQSFSDGIRDGMDAIWRANFITQTPPSLT